MCAYRTLMFNHFSLFIPFSSQNYRYDMNTYEPIPTTAGHVVCIWAWWVWSSQLSHSHDDAVTYPSQEEVNMHGIQPMIGLYVCKCAYIYIYIYVYIQKCMCHKILVTRYVYNCIYVYQDYCVAGNSWIIIYIMYVNIYIYMLISHNFNHLTILATNW